MSVTKSIPIGRSILAAWRGANTPICSALTNKCQKTKLTTFCHQMHQSAQITTTEITFPSFMFTSSSPKIGCRTATISDKKEIIDFLCKMFLSREPLMSALRATEADARPFVEYHVKDALKNNASFVAVDEMGSICGIRLNAVGPATEEDKPKDFGVKMNILEKFLEHVEGNITERLQTPRFMRHIAICVNPDIVRSGVGTMMMQKSVDYARDHGLRYMVATCSGQVATKLALKMGFRVVRQVLYEKYSDSDMYFSCFPDDCLVKPASFKPFVSVAPQHYSAKLLIKNVL
ncbi:arylalkylamine N-acetyltransferase-like 2 [Styela clava]